MYSTSRKQARIRVTVQMPEDLHALARARARDLEISLSELLRRSVERDVHAGSEPTDEHLHGDGNGDLREGTEGLTLD